MEVECPRCLYSFFPGVPLFSKDTPKDLVYAHECKTGYIRIYPQFMCSSCGPFNEETSLLSLRGIAETNHRRKLDRIRMDDEKEEVNEGR